MKPIRRNYCYWLRLGAQGVTLSVCLSVCPFSTKLSRALNLHLRASDSSWWLHEEFMKTSGCLQDVFRMTSGWLQDESESIKQAFREHSEYSEITQKALREYFVIPSEPKILRLVVLIIHWTYVLMSVCLCVCRQIKILPFPRLTRFLKVTQPPP